MPYDGHVDSAESFTRSCACPTGLSIALAALVLLTVHYCEAAPLSRATALPQRVSLPQLLPEDQSPVSQPDHIPSHRPRESHAMPNRQMPRATRRSTHTSHGAPAFRHTAARHQSPQYLLPGVVGASAVLSAAAVALCWGWNDVVHRRKAPAPLAMFSATAVPCCNTIGAWAGV